jgi:hypothetical protein
MQREFVLPCRSSCKNLINHNNVLIRRLAKHFEMKTILYQTFIIKFTAQITSKKTLGSKFSIETKGPLKFLNVSK